MKYLSDYMKDKQTEIFNKYDVFFAFSKKQFDEKANAGVKYVDMRHGMFCNEDNVKKVTYLLDDVYKDAIKEDLKDNGKKKIIHRELANRECQIAMDYSEVIAALEDYGITKEEVIVEWKEYFQKCVDNDWF